MVEEWLPKAKPKAREEALPELARRYFTGHGPATLRDFAWWSGLTLAEARRATDMAGKTVDQVMLEGHRYWFAAQSSARSKRGGRSRK